MFKDVLNVILDAFKRIRIDCSVKNIKSVIIDLFNIDSKYYNNEEEIEDIVGFGVGKIKKFGKR